MHRLYIDVTKKVTQPFNIYYLDYINSWIKDTLKTSSNKPTKGYSPFNYQNYLYFQLHLNIKS